MAGLFIVLTLYAVARGATSARPTVWHILAVAACLAGMASKETAVVIPPLVLAYDRAFLSASWREAWRRRKGLYIGLAAASLYLTLPVFVPGLAAGMHDRQSITLSLSYLPIQSRVIAHYLRLAVWPHPLCLDYGWTAQPGSFGSPLAGGLVALLAVAAAWLAWRRPRAGFAGVWFGFLLIPTSSVLPLTDIAFDHRMYLPLAGLATAGVLALAALSRRLTASPVARRLVFAVPLALMVVALAIATHIRNRDYHDSEHMWSTVLACRPDNVRAAVCLTAELYDRHRDDQVIAAARSTLARVLPPSGAPRGPRLAEAQAAFERAVALAPGHVRAHLNFAGAALAVGDTNTAWREIGTALSLAPHDPDALQDAADLHAITGQSATAAALYRQALTRRPDHPPLRRRLAWLLATCPDPAVRNGAEALQLAQSVVAADGGQDPESLETLAAALAESGSVPRAAELQAQIVAGVGSTPERQARLTCYQAGQPWRDLRLAPQK